MNKYILFFFLDKPRVHFSYLVGPCQKNLNVILSPCVGRKVLQEHDDLLKFCHLKQLPREAQKETGTDVEVKISETILFVFLLTEVCVPHSNYQPNWKFPH